MPVYGGTLRMNLIAKWLVCNGLSVCKRLMEIRCLQAAFAVASSFDCSSLRVVTPCTGRYMLHHTLRELESS